MRFCIGTNAFNEEAFKYGSMMADNIPREFINLLLTKIDIVDLINTQIQLRKKSGNNYFACCPFHNEKSASFSVSQQKQFYHCFGCGAHGNAIDFMIQRDRLNFPEAIEALARYAGMEVPKTKTMQEKVATTSHLYELTAEVATYFYKRMCHSERAIAYLKNRQISGITAKQFQIGYAPSGWSHLLEQHGKTPTKQKHLIETGLLVKKTDGGCYDRFRDRIMFPIHDHRGRVIGFGGRVLDQGEPKYLNSPETILFQKGQELYGLYQCLQTHSKLQQVLIVEGYMDVVALFQHGINYAVATLGTATTEQHIKRLTRYTSDLIFCFDGDEAGRKAASRALDIIFPLMNDRLQVRFLFLPEGEDPDSMVRKLGKDQFTNQIRSALSLSAFFLQHLSEQSDMATMEGRARFAAAALNQAKILPDIIFKKMLLEEVAKRARVQLSDLNVLKSQNNSQQITEISAKIHPSVKITVGLLLQYPHFIQYLKEELPANHLGGYQFFLQLIDIIHKEPTITTGRLVEFFRGRQEEKLVTSLSKWQQDFSEESAKSEFLGAVRQLKLAWIDTEINRLLAKATHPGLTEVEKIDLSNWINKKQQWKKEIIN